LVSVIVRRRDRRCVTCGEAWGLQCSHFFSRRYLRTRFHLADCPARRANCNRRHNEDPGPYLRFMRERYGEDAVKDLEEFRAGGGKVTDEELRRELEGLKALA
jgi:hypothetical protein